MTAKNYGLISSTDMLSKFVDRLVSAGSVVAMDIETGYGGEAKAGASLHPEDPNSRVVGVSFTNSTDWARYVPLGHDLGDNLDNAETAILLWKLFTSVPIISHNASFEMKFLRTWFLRWLTGGKCLPTTLGDSLGIGFEGNPVPDEKLAQEIIDVDGYWPIFSDTMIEAHIAQEHPQYGLKFLTKAIFGHEQQDLLSLFPGLPKNKSKTLRFNTLTLTPEVVAYACEDAVWCLALHQYFYPKVGQRFIYKTEMSVVPSTNAMETTGAAFDWAAMEKDAARATVFAELYDAEIQSDLTEQTGRPVLINLNSPVQLRTVLFASKEEGGLGLKSAKSTDTGLDSTGAVAMEALSKKHPTVRKILDLKELRTLSTKFLDKYPKEYRYAPDGRAHPSFLQTNVISGRYACSNPNLQQSPSMFTVDTPDQEKAKVSHYYKLSDGTDRYFAINFREYIISPIDHYTFGFDYSQVELRVLAGEAKEPFLIKAFEDGVDVHSATAALMFGLLIEEVTKDLRGKGKTLNFSLLYQMGIKSLADRLAVSVEEAKRLYDLYFASYSNIESWIAKVTSDAYRDGYSQSRFGRIHRIWDFLSSDEWKRKNGERLAVNAPIQGSAADYAKVAMVRCRKALKEANLLDKVHIFLNVHDALEFYVHNSVNPHDLIEVMEPAVVFPIEGWPAIKADWHMGMSLGSLQEIDRDSDLEVPTALPKATLVVEEISPVVEKEPTTPLAVVCPPETPTPDYVPEMSGQELRVVIERMPTAEQYKQFLALVKGAPGPHEVRLVTPQGELVLETKAGNLTTALTPQDQGRISLLLGGATATWTSGTIDVSQLAAGLEL